MSKIIQMGFMILILQCVVFSQKNETNEIIPKVIDEVYLGMTPPDFVKMRPNIESGTTIYDCFERGVIFFCKSRINDPNDPTKISTNPYSWDLRRFKENIEHPIFKTIRYGIGPKLGSIKFLATINTTRKAEKFDKNRNKLFYDAIEKWGKPSKIVIGKSSGKLYYYQIIIEWVKNDYIIKINCPLNFNKYFESSSLIDKIWCKVFNIGPEIILSIQQKNSPWEFNINPLPISEEKTKELLKSIGFYDMLKESTNK